MSEENAPKLRLKPKLAPEATTPTSQAATPDAGPSALPFRSVSSPPESLVPPAEPHAPKFVRLKPRLAAMPPIEESPASEIPVETPAVEQPSASSAPVEPVAPAAPAEPAATEGKPVMKFTLRPKGAGPVAASVAAAAPVAPVAPVTSLASSSESAAGESENPAPDASVSPAPIGVFPPPTAKFPAPPMKSSPAASKEKPSSKKGITVGVLMGLLVGGAYFAYSTFMGEPPVETPPPRMAENPVTSQGKAVAKAQAVVNQVAQNAAAVDAQSSAPAAAQTASPAPAGDVPGVTAAAPAVEPTAPVSAPAPVVAPVASLPFRAWVDQLRVGAVLGGSTPKVFIGGTAYLVGDLVNPQLGIIFEGYDSQTRILMFKDRSGATLEKRN